MNKQDLVKEYKDYGYSAQEIAQELNMPISLVNSALEGYKLPTTSYKAKETYKTYANDKTFRTRANDKTLPMYEVLYEYGPKDINRMVSTWGLTMTAKFTGYTKNNLIALKYHYGYHNHIPMDALDKTTYFSEAIRREVDARDDRHCIRCTHPLGIKDIRYHKITHPAPMSVNVCATLCKYCRSTKILPNYEVFDGMRYEEFKEWVLTNDPYVKRPGNTRTIHR
ncbi:MAG: hypothetical protein H8D23_17610 [Candidatus Brocadiales bacterium]|nr:hypothetical protein [Candidatus Brocadiales bacterium]